MAQIDTKELLQMINSSVDAALKKNDIPDTPSARMDILMGMHRLISDEGIHDQNDRAILRLIEDEAVRLSIEFM